MGEIEMVEPNALTTRGGAYGDPAVKVHGLCLDRDGAR
jgi:hypothetical protein